jgi:hypothetical protein
MKKLDENTFEITSWIELQEVLFDGKDTDLDRFRSDYAYRGAYNAEHRLITSLQRLGRKPSESERHIIRNFKKYSPINTLIGQYENIWNWIALGQHYGLPTRLLDWSFSPYIALHFMADFEKGFDQDGAIWMVNFIEIRKTLPKALTSKILEKGILTFTPAELAEEIGNSIEEIEAYKNKHDNFLMFMEPPSIDDRIISQFALSSFMLDPDSDKNAYLKDHPTLYKKLIVPAHLKWEIRDKLDQANISERIIYPGLEGLSKWLKRWYYEKNEDKRWSLKEPP